MRRFPASLQDALGVVVGFLGLKPQALVFGAFSTWERKVKFEI